MTREKVSELRAMPPEHKLLIAWVAAPIIYDLRSREGGTFSEGIHRLRREHPVLVNTAIVTTALHFMEGLPKRIDPFHQGLKAVKGDNKMKIRGEELGLWFLAGSGAAVGALKYIIHPAFEDYVVKPAKSSLGRFALSREINRADAETATIHQLSELSLLPRVSEAESSDLTRLAA